MSWRPGLNANTSGSAVMFVFYCYVTNYYNHSDLRQHVLLSHSFCGLGIWVEISGVLCFRVNHKVLSALGSYLKARVGNNLLLKGHWTEGLEATLIHLSCRPLQHGSLLHQSPEGQVTILCNLTVGTGHPLLFNTFYWLKQVMGPAHTQEEGITQGCNYEEMGITGPIVEAAPQPHPSTELEGIRGWSTFKPHLPGPFEVIFIKGG